MSHRAKGLLLRRRPRVSAPSQTWAAVSIGLSPIESGWLGELESFFRKKPTIEESEERSYLFPEREFSIEALSGFCSPTANRADLNLRQDGGVT